MKKKYLYNGKYYTEEQMNDFASQSNLHIDDYIKELGDKVQSFDAPYEYNGKSFSEPEMTDFAKQSNLSLNDYLGEIGLKKKDTTSSQPIGESGKSIAKSMFTSLSNSNVQSSSNENNTKANVQPYKTDASTLGGNFLINPSSDKVTQANDVLSNQDLAKQNSLRKVTKSPQITNPDDRTNQQILQDRRNDINKQIDFLSVDDKNVKQSPVESSFIAAPITQDVISEDNPSSSFVRRQQKDNLDALKDAKQTHDLLDHNTLEEAAIKKYNPSMDNMTLEQYKRENNATAGNYLVNFASNPEVQFRAAHDPKVKTQLVNLENDLVSQFPDYAKTLLASKISDKMDAMGLTNSFANNPSKEQAQSVMDELIKSGEVPQSFQKIFDNHLAPQIDKATSWTNKLAMGIPLANLFSDENPIKTRGVFENALEGTRDYYKGFAHTFNKALQAPIDLARSNFGQDPNVAIDRNAANTEEQNQQTQFNPQGFGKYTTTAGKLIGTVLGNISTAGLGTELGASENIANGLSFVMSNAGRNMDKAEQDLPNNPAGQILYTTAMGTLDYMLGGSFTKSIEKGAAGVLRKDMADIIDKYTTGEISSAAAKDLTKKTLLQNGGEFVTNMAKHNLIGASMATAPDLLGHVLNNIFSDKPNPITSETAKNLLNNFTTNFWATSAISWMPALGESGNKMNAGMMYEQASNPEFRNEMMKNGANEEQLHNYDIASKILSELKQANVPEEDLPQLLLHEVNQKVLSEKAANTQSPSLKEQVKQKIETSKQAAQKILNKTPPEIKPIPDEQPETGQSTDLSGTGNRNTENGQTGIGETNQGLQTDNSTSREGVGDKKPLTKEAEDLLASIGEGSKPTFISKNLERIANENDIEVTGKMSADDVVNALKEKQKANENTKPTEEAQPTNKTVGYKEGGQQLSSGKTIDDNKGNLEGSERAIKESKAENTSGLSSEAVKEGFTEVSDLNKMYADAKAKYGDKKGAAIYEAANRLVNPNKNTIVEIKSNGVTVKEGDKYIFKPFGNTDANSKKWTLYKGIDVTDRFTTKPTKNEDIKSTEEKGSPTESLNQTIKPTEESQQNTNGQVQSESSREQGSTRQPPTNTEPTVEGEGENKGTRISKAGLKEDYGFVKNFASKSDQSIADATMQRLKTRADDSGISTQQQAANEVAAMKNKKGEASEHDIMTTAYHLMNLDEQLKSADERNAPSHEIDVLRNQHEEALTTLRQLGNNSGRNLRLFGTVFKKTAENAIETSRIEIKRLLGVDDIPKTVKDLEKSNLTASDKNKVRPYVETIETLQKEVTDINKKTDESIKGINDKEVQDYIKSEVARRLAESKGGKQQPKEKTLGQKGKDVADKIRKLKTDKGNLNVDFSFGTWNLAIEGIAKLVEGGATIAEAIEKLIKDKTIGFKTEKDKNSFEASIIHQLSYGERKDAAIEKIKSFAENENATTITKDMADKGLIKDVVDSHISTDIPYDKVIDEATKELKQHLPDIKKSEVEDALLHRGEFKQQTKEQASSEVKQKAQDVRRLAYTESKVRALEAADDIHNIQNDNSLSKEEKNKAIEARKSDYEKDLDEKLKNIQKQKSELENQKNKAKNEAEKIKQLNDEADRIKTEKTIFTNAVKSASKTSEALKSARKNLEDAYNKAGIRPEKGNKTEIQIAKESDDAIKDIQDSDLPDDVKKEHIKQIEEDRDTQLNGTRQGVLTNLKTNIDNHVADLTQRINDAKDEDVSSLKELKKDLQDLSNRLKPNGENLKDQIDKADQDLNAILKTNKGNDLEDDLKSIQKDYHADWQKTSNELHRKSLMDKAINEQKESERRLNAGQYTEIPTTPYDIQRDAALLNQRSATQKAWKQLNSMKLKAQKESSVMDKALSVRRSLLISSFGAIEKVAGSAITKPIFDPLLKQTWGRLSGLITGIKPTEAGRIGDVFRQLPSEQAAQKFMVKRNNGYVDSIINYENALKTKDANKIKSAKTKMDKAEVDHAASLAYLFINAGSHIDIQQIMVNAATDFDAKVGKYHKSYANERTKLQGFGYWLESVNRTHSALKSISARTSLIDGYIENLQYLQSKEGGLSQDTRLRAWDMATLHEYEQGRFGERTLLSDKIGQMRSSKNPLVRHTTNFLFPVAKISINITKQGIDRALPIELMVRTLGTDAAKGMKLNKEDGIEFGNFASKYYNGIKRGFDELPLEQKKYINTLLMRGMAGVAQYTLVGFLLSSGAIKYGGAYNPNDPFKKKFKQAIGSDGEPLKEGEWEFFGWKSPKLLNMVVNHSPYSLPMSLAADYHTQISQEDKKGRQAMRAFQSMTNEVIARMPFAGIFDLGQGLFGGDEYKLERTIANSVPSFKGTAEYFDKDESGNPTKRTSNDNSFWGRTLDMWKQNVPGLRNTLPMKGESESSGKQSKQSNKTVQKKTSKTSSD